MAVQSAIEWTQSTWNPVTGCTKVSLGCQNCYAERMAKRLQAMGQPNYHSGFAVTCHPELLELPLRWKKPQIIFANSMSDLFHEQIPVGFIQQVFATMRRAGHHVFQVLTKRAGRLAEISPLVSWSDNVWMGVTVETGAYEHRIAALRSTGAFVKFLSLEPLLADPEGLDFTGIDWVIAGGESGPKSRPMRVEWVRGIREQCRRRKIPFFFKQWGGVNKKKSGRVLDGRTWDEMPVAERTPGIHMARAAY